MFKIRKLDSISPHIAIVTALSYENPLSLISEIEDELIATLGPSLNGELVFDLLCSNGFEWNRFISVSVESSAINRSSTKIVDEHDLAQSIIDAQKELFASKPEYLYDSILTQQEILSITG